MIKTVWVIAAQDNRVGTIVVPYGLDKSNCKPYRLIVGNEYDSLESAANAIEKHCIEIGGNYNAYFVLPKVVYTK